MLQAITSHLYLHIEGSPFETETPARRIQDRGVKRNCLWPTDLAAVAYDSRTTTSFPLKLEPILQSRSHHIPPGPTR